MALPYKFVGVLIISLGFVTGCLTQQAEEESVKNVVLEEKRLITVGDISDEPAKKVKRFQPLADYLARELRGYGITEGRVLIAPDIETMARYLREGEVDLYMDSPFPIVEAIDRSGAEPILRRWKGGEATYHSVFFARRGSGIENLDSLWGKMVVFEEPFSTSGYLLPKGVLLKKGYKLTHKTSRADAVSQNEVGYVFSRDDENTVIWVWENLGSLGATSNQDFEEIPEVIKKDLLVVGRSIEVPRQLVVVRPGLDPAFVNKMKEALTALESTEEGRGILEALKDTKKFDELPPDAMATLEALRETRFLVDRSGEG